MTDNHFDLAAAMLSDAADLLGHLDAGTTTIPDHAYGPLTLTATTDGHHTLILWAADHNDRVLAAVEATRHADTGQAHPRVTVFRAAGLMFGARHNHTFTAAGHHSYTLTADTGADTWQLSIDDDTHTLTGADLDAALHLIAESDRPVGAAG